MISEETRDAWKSWYWQSGWEAVNITCGIESLLYPLMNTPSPSCKTKESQPGSGMSMSSIVRGIYSVVGFTLPCSPQFLHVRPAWTSFSYRQYTLRCNRNSQNNDGKYKIECLHIMLSIFFVQHCRFFHLVVMHIETKFFYTTYLLPFYSFHTLKEVCKECY